MIVHYLDARSVGGIETHVETLVRAQREAGLPATIVLHASYPDNPVERRYREAGLDVRIAGGALALPRMLAALGATLLHTHGYKAGIFGRLAARVAGVPAVSTFHAGERGKGKVGLYQTADEWTSFLGQRIAVSEPIAAKLPFAATVVRNFVKPAAVARIAPDRPCFVFAGRLSHEKGPDLFCRLAQRNPEAGAWQLYGAGPMDAELRSAYPSAVEFRGFADRMPAVLSGATALVMTSRNEGLPMAALEAMAIGVPVIAPRLGALPQLIRDGVDGFLFEAGDEAAMDKALKSFAALGRNGQAAMGERARRAIVERYSPAAVLPSLFEVYRRAGWAASISTKVQSSAG